MATVDPDDFGKAVLEVLQTFVKSTETILDEVAVTVGKETVRQLKGSSPTNPKGKHSGRYAKGWAIKRTKKGEVYVHNKTDYQLTHLLEHGHRIVSWGKDTGRKTKAQPHISVAEKFCREKFISELSSQLKFQK